MYSSKERYEAYINSLYEDNAGLLGEIEKEARNDHVPIIRKETQGFLRFILREKKPLSVLEIGTAVGFSALFLAKYSPGECHITTIESYKKRADSARENFLKAGEDERIELLFGDAAKILPKLTGPYDLIFLDAAKGQYINFLDDVIRLLSPGGILLADNVFHEGEIIESRYALKRRERTIHTRMRKYLFAITHTDELTSSIIPLGDGIAVSVREENDGT